MTRAKRTSSAQPSPADAEALRNTPQPEKRRNPRQGHSVVPRVLQPHAGGIDIGATRLFAAVSPERTDKPVRSFETFTENLYELAAWLKEHGVTSVAMESTGVYWIPVLQVLEECGIEVCLVNAHHVKNVPGRKTDVQDCQWLQYLHAVGLLRGSFQPPPEILGVRTVLRHRGNVVTDSSRHIQHMQKSLTQMNVHLHHVLSDLSGVSGLAIVDAILAGERDPAVLVQLREPGVKASEETMRKALVGDYRPEHLFTLQQARAAYQFCREQLRECDQRVEELLAQLRSQIDPAEIAPPAATGPKHRARKGEIDLPTADLRTELQRILGTDVTPTPGLGTSIVCSLVAELGPDLSDFPSVSHFSSWLALCPNPKISGGRVLRKGTRPVKHRVATLFRLAAQSVARSNNALGAFYRRMRAKLGAPAAITATAHKLARIYYHLVTTKQAYDESIFQREEEAHQKRRLERVKREAVALGFTLTAAVPST
jgi:transposase